MNRTPRVWFITGTSSGLGAAFAHAALECGDRVAATVRQSDDAGLLRARFGDEVLPLLLDVRDRDAVFRSVAEAATHFGQLDVVVNNAGYGLVGAVEEVVEADAREQLDVNFFGSLWVIQAALPYLRSRQSGHIIQVSSMGGVFAYPTMGMYHASKWAVEGMAEALRAEVAGFGIKVTLLQPGSHETGARNRLAGSPRLASYSELHDRVVGNRPRRPPGDPSRAARALLQLLEIPDPPMRLPLGSDAVVAIRAALVKRAADHDRWDDLARTTDRPD